MYRHLYHVVPQFVQGPFFPYRKVRTEFKLCIYFPDEFGEVRRTTRFLKARHVDKPIHSHDFIHVVNATINKPNEVARFTVTRIDYYDDDDTKHNPNPCFSRHFKQKYKILTFERLDDNYLSDSQIADYQKQEQSHGIPETFEKAPS